MSKKVVLKLEVFDEKRKQKAMRAVSRFPGVESLAMDMGEKKLTVIGDVDPVQIVGKLRKSWCTEILSVGPAKEKKEDGKKEDGKKEDGKDKEKDPTKELLELYKKYYPHYTQYYHVYSAEENPNACVIF